jgi:hypothetical protein
MSMEPRGAVLLIEVRAGDARRKFPPEAVDARLAEAKLLLEGSASGTWSPAGGAALSGSLAVRDAAEAFPLLHRLRSELRADPSRPPVVLAAGIGRGDEMEGSRLAAEAFRSIGRKRRRFTRCLTNDAHANVVLGALCRMLDSLVGGWTDAQWQAIHRRDSGRTLQQIGEELGIAYQNVSKRLIAAQYSLYREILDAAGLVFSKADSPHI